jgi:hypothetical protein
MAVSYATTGFSFVDSIDGTGSSTTSIKSLVPIAIDRKYHRQVQKKTFFAKMGLIGEDTHSEGNYLNSLPGMPVIRKTELSAGAGDAVKMGLRLNLSHAVSTGVVGSTQLVDAETNPAFKNFTQKVERWRQGVRTDGGMDIQRSPYDMESAKQELLEDWTAQVQDTSILYAAHYRYAPHQFRVGGHTIYAPSKVVNDLVGNDVNLSTSRTVADLNGTSDDNLCAKTFELAALYCEQNDFDPVMIDGQPYWLSLVSPQGAFLLQQDDRFRNSWLYARERGASNPIFRNSEFVYNNHIIFKYDKVRTILGGSNPAGLTVSNQVITEADYTGVGGSLTASTQLHQMYTFGANAIALAEGVLKMTGVKRSENDYGNILGTGVDNIFGAGRIDWAVEGGGTLTNQGLLLTVNSIVL